MLTKARWLRRSLAIVGACVAFAMIFVATEWARPTPTALGSFIGVMPLTPRLASIADRLAIAHHVPTQEQRAFVRRAAVAQPLNALPYYIVGAAGHAEARNRALVAMALHRDPRLRPAWWWTTADSAKQGDVPSATRGLIRLAVLNPGNTALWYALAKISADPAARAVIKAQIRAGGAWRDGYLTALNESPVDRAVVFEMLEAVGRHTPGAVAAPADPLGDRRAFVAALVARKDYDRAYLAWVQWLPAASQDAVGRVFDPTFKGRVALPPFAWQFPDGSGGAAQLDSKAGLTLDFFGVDDVTAAQQTVLLPPGRYRLATQARFDPVASEAPSPPLAWRLTCLFETKPLSELAVPVDGGARPVTGAAFQVPQGCGAQSLELKVNSADLSRRLSATIRSVTIEDAR